MSNRIPNSFGTYLSALRQFETSGPRGQAEAKFRILGTLAKQGPMTLPQITAASRVNSPTVIQAIEPMVELGLVEFVPADLSQAAERKFSITETGKQMLSDPWVVSTP